MLIKEYLQAIQNTLLRELKRLGKNPIYFIGSVVVMSFSFVFFLSLFEEGQPLNMPVAVVDNDNSSLSRQFVRNADALQHVSIDMKCANYTEARRAMQAGKVYAIIQIPADFASKMYTGRQPEVTYYVNDSYLVAGSLILKDLSYLGEVTNAGIKQKTLQAKGLDNNMIMSTIQPIVMNTHLIANPWVNYGSYLLNILFPGILEIMILMLTIYSIGSELKQRTSAEWLLTANNSITAALTGKLIPQTIVFTILGMISNILLYKHMGYPLHSSIIWMFFVTFMYVLAYQAIGVLIIGITPVLRDGITIAAVFGLVGITMAGATFPVEQLVYQIQIFSHLFPIRHYFIIYVNQALNGLPLAYSIINIAALVGFTFLPLLVLKRLKKAAINQNFPIK